MHDRCTDTNTPAERQLEAMKLKLTTQVQLYVLFPGKYSYISIIWFILNGRSQGIHFYCQHTSFQKGPSARKLHCHKLFTSCCWLSSITRNFIFAARMNWFKVQSSIYRYYIRLEGFLHFSLFADVLQTHQINL